MINVPTIPAVQKLNSGTKTVLIVLGAGAAIYLAFKLTAHIINLAQIASLRNEYNLGK